MQKQLSPCLGQLSPGQIKPEGWLKSRLRAQADGLCGNLDKFWPDVRDSAWIGGPAEGWERVPYWLDGFIPLAFLLEDEDLKGRAKFYVDNILSRQEEDGWICPCPREKRGDYDVWAYFLVLKVLTVYEEAAGDPRVEGAVRRALVCLDRHLDANLLFDWAQTRWFECLIPIFWLYERTGEAWLLTLAKRLKTQGFDWEELFRSYPYTDRTQKGRWAQDRHVVNNAMMLKAYALWYRISGDPEDLKKGKRFARILDRYHGQVHGGFSGDECLAGLSPSQGTELCSIAEAMYSCVWLFRVTRDPYWMDRMDTLAFNALPATLSPDMWTHQYVQQVNQAVCKVTPSQEHCIYTTNRPDANTFGLEPDFGCCTVNLSQAYPKLAQSCVFPCAQGVVFGTYLPCEAAFTLPEGGDCRVRVDTGYPFRETVRIVIKADTMQRAFFRIPEWARGARISSRGETREAEAGELFAWTLQPGREQEFILTLPAKTELLRRPQDLYVLKRGALVYSIPVPEKWTRIHEDVSGREFPHCDYELEPAGEYAYAFCGGDRLPGEAEFVEKELRENPFQPEDAPTELWARVCPVTWRIVDGALTRTPESVVPTGEEKRVRMIPYGCTGLRVTELAMASYL